jgi:protein O-GlcNAc transferase
MINPQLAQALALLRQGQVQSAAALMAQVLRTTAPANIPALDRNDPNAQFVLALGLCELRRHEEAEPYFARAAQLRQGYAVARFVLGNQCFDAGDFEGAARHYAAYAKLYPQDAQGWINLGLSWMNGSAWQNARFALERAIALVPTQPKPAAMLATTLKQAGAAPAELIAALQRATALNTGRADLHLDLARCLIGADRFGEAKAALRRVLELDPGNTTAAWLEFQYPDDVVAPTQAAREQFLTRWHAGIERFLAIDWREPRHAAQADSTIASTTNFYLAYLGLPLIEEQRRNAQVLRRLTFAASQDAAETTPRTIDRARRKIAIFSPSLNSHAVGKVWAGALLALDPAEFELGIFHPAPNVDASAERFRERAACFESDMRSVNEWITTLRAFAPDVLVFLDVGMHQFVQAVASLRLAPVQVATWGHPVTTGMATIDYFLGADACEPRDADQHYTERLVRLPRLGTWLELPDPAQPRATDAQDNAIRFLCTQSADKLHPGHDLLFARILADTPGATLDLLCNKPTHVAHALVARMRDAFAQAGVDFDARCRVHGRLAFDEYRKFLARAHICLDSLDFSGGITSLDCLWHDLPIVTLPGALMRGRQTFGMLQLLGLDDLIARDIDDYVRIAVNLAHDEHWRQALQARISARKHELYRDESVVKALSEFLRTVQPPVSTAS